MKKVKTITIILAIILVTLVAFAGVYIKTQNRMENKVKDYILGKEISGRRILEVIVHNHDEETEGTATETKPEDLTVENYEIVKKTIEKRLKNLKAQDYTISLNKENGTIRVELAEDENTDTYAYYLTASGKVQIKEKDTETELLSDSMIKKATYNYTSNTSGAYQVYLEIELTKEGQAKIEEIANNYAVLADEIDKIEEEQKEDNSDEASNDDTGTNEDGQTQKDVKKIAVLSIGGTEYDISKIEKNKITVKVGAQTSNSTSVNSNMSKAAEICMLINSGKYPIEYEVSVNRYVYSDISKNELIYFALVILVLILVILIVFSIKYKMKGLLCSISCIGFISLYSLLLRYTNVLISIEGIGAIIFIIAINLKLNQIILSKIRNMNMVSEAINSTYKDVFLKLIPVMILSITFCFAGWTNLNSFGMIMFWGLILIAVYNITVTKALLKLRENK